MYNGIGLRTVRGSGTNGYVQRNLSYINASRTRQTLVHNKRNGSLESFGTHEGGKSRPPHSADILRHEQKRRVELELLELSLNMEERGCDPKVIQDKVKRERERLLTRLHGEGIRDEEKAKDAESSHARQKRKDKEIERIKDAFSIASDYMEGESFDPEMQERRRLERKEKRKQEGKEKEEELQLSQKKREAETMARREPLMSRSRSRPLQDCRSRDCDDAKSRKSQSHSTVKKRRLRRSSALSDWKRRSVSSSCDSSSGRSRSRLHSQKLRKEKCREKDFASTRKAERIVRSRSASSLDSSSDVGCSNELSRGNKTTATKGKKLSASGSPR
ncbi:unnamed protein product [Peronospora belbahrii]|uniref:CWF21 domain-containing protein n=1 Tax=Peronospora belbahrii TaxID=622444 RepID=A0ABN8CVK1_9STRA|nr:unnamed protein product [Peronospora belbahrii]